MSKIQKCANKFFHCFLCGPKKVGTNGGILWKREMGEVVGVNVPTKWYMNSIIISAQTVLLPMS
jgi:hypothetical protein